MHCVLLPRSYLAFLTTLTDIRIGKHQVIAVTTCLRFAARVNYTAG